MFEVRIGDQCEVFSGSANLVDGPSMENATFAVTPQNKVIKKYVEPLKPTLPAAPDRPNHHLMIRLTENGWIATTRDGAAPEVT